MNVIGYTEPWRLVSRLHREADRLLARRLLDGEAAGQAEWVPAVDVREEAERFVIEADLPGVQPADLDITLEKGVLTIEGKRTTRSADEQAAYPRIERVSGRFYRRFSLPDTADTEAVAADYRDGVLLVTVPKRAQAQPRRIEVRAS